MATCRCFLPGRAGLSQGLAGALLRGASLLHVLAAGGCIQIPAAPRSLLDGGALDGGAPGDTGVDGGRGWDGGSQDAGRPRQDAAVSDAGRPPDGATCPIVACPDDENSCTGPGVVTPDCRCDHPHIQEGEECDDHDRCTRRDRCRSGQCVGEDPLLCEGVASACREQRCDRATGDCMPTPIHDGEACPTGPECAAEPCRCAAGSCLPCQPSCTERRCGENGCGGSCGECGDAEECALPAGRCVPQGMAALAVAPGEGIFAMGSPPEEDGRNDADEQQHQVLLSPFLIDRLEVSQQQYQSCVDDAEARCPEPTGCRSGLLDWQPGLGPKAGKELLPVRCASWAMAEAYCRFAGKRLCSEAEWELACAGTAHRSFPWGTAWPDDASQHANCAAGYCGDAHQRTAPVGSLRAGATPVDGVLDLAGNVAEWVQDFYEAPYETRQPWMENPRGPCAGLGPCDGHLLRVLRGGHYGSPRADLRCAARQAEFEQLEPNDVPDQNGIRCCRDLEPAE